MSSREQTTLTEVYDALRDAQGVSEETARKASEAVAGFASRFAKIEPELPVVKWMVGFGVALLLRRFAH